MKKLVYVGFAFPHHKGLHCGYHRIREFVHYDEIIDCQHYFDNYFAIEKWSIFNKICQRVFNARLVPYYVFKMWFKGLFSKNRVYHFVYSESLYLPFPRYIGKKNKAVCVIHQPYDIVEKWGMMDRVKSADAVILMGNTEVEKFKMITGKDNVYFIPHGISTDFYFPQENVQKEHILLTVGDWLRDFKFANKVYHKLLEKDPELKIVIVSNPKNKKDITPHNRIEFLSGISDEALRELYCTSSILFLPLTRYTANNALLEAGATGCNVVIATDSKDNSYIPDTMLNIVPMDVDLCVERLVEKFSYTYNYDLAKFVNNHFSWDVIGKRTEELLLSI